MPHPSERHDLSKYTVPSSFVGIAVPTKVEGMLVVSAVPTKVVGMQADYQYQSRYKNKMGPTFNFLTDQLRK